MTKHECCVFMAYTGLAFCPFDEFHKYTETLLGRELYNIEFGSEELKEELKRKSRVEFNKILDNIWEIN